MEELCIRRKDWRRESSLIWTLFQAPVGSSVVLEAGRSYKVAGEEGINVHGWRAW